MSITRSSAGPDAAPIAIIGMGCMFPRAGNLQEYWRLLRTGADGITETPATHWSLGDYLDPDPKAPDMTYCGRGGFLPHVPFDPTEFGIPPTILEATDTSQLLGLVVAKAALEDAGYGEGRDFNRDRASVILGITGLQELSLPLGARLGHPIWRRALAEAGISPEVAEDVVHRISDSYVAWQENSFPGLLGNVVAGRIANRLNLRGTNCVVDAACASSLSAVHLAMMELATHRCDIALAGGVDTLNDIFMYMCFSKTPALSPTGDARPFSDDADGTVLGEGIGMIVLKRLSDAQRDGDRIYAVIRAMGTSSDGRSQSIYAPHAGGQARALRNAYSLAGFEPDSVTLIEAHGTGTTVGDAVEFEALKTVFREAASDGAWCAVGSVKSQIGHTKAAAGAAGLIKVALSIYHGVLPPTIKIKAPNAKLGISDSPFYLNTELRPWLACNGHPRRAGVSSFGFGGSNFHAVLEEDDATLPAPAWDGSVEIIALSANSLRDLQDALNDWQAAVAAEHFNPHQLAWRAAASRRAFDADHEHRLLIVVQSQDDLVQLLTKANERLMSCTTDGESTLPNVYYGRGPAIGKVAFLFPGQGSQYINMGRELACTFPEMQSALASADTDDMEPRLTTAIYPPPTFCEDARIQHAKTLMRTEFAQPALGGVSLGMANVLKRFGVRPDFVAGHSYGELVALCVADAYDATTLHQLSRLRGRLMAAGDDDRGTMLAVKAPLTDIARMIDEESLEVVLANRNTPTQGVLSGPRGAIALTTAACKARGFASQALPVDGAFHSRLVESALAPFRQALESVEFKEPSVPVFSNTTASAYSLEAARGLLANQIIQPVDFVGEINNLYESDVRTFVEVGPKTVLTGLVTSILANRPHRAFAMDSSVGRGSAIADLARLLAHLAAEGRSVDLTRWEKPGPEPRKPRMVVPLVGANYSAPRSATVSAARTEMPATRVCPSRSDEHLGRSPGGATDNSPGREPWETGRQIEQAPAGRQKTTDIARSTRSEQVDGATIEDPGVEPVREAQPPSPMLADALRLVQDGIQAMQALQQQTAEAHRRFLEGQEQAHRTIQQMMENQHRVLASSLGIAPPQPVPAALPLAVGPVTPASCVQVGPVPQRRLESPQTAPTIQPAPVAPPPRTSYESVVLEVVCEKTGYPREMIDLDMDIEADLGIDSIKRVEIVAAVEERIPSFTGIKPEYMGSIRTLREIVAFINGGVETHASVAEPLAIPVRIESGPTTNSTFDRDGFSATLLTVVSELTGYPREMLDLSMDLEADLGIDSIKRVEILAAVEARVPHTPAVQPEYMGSLRTLEQIVEYCSGSTTTGKSPAPGRPISESTTTQPAMAAGKLLERRVLSSVELPLAQPGGLPLAQGGEVWITDDGTSLATELAACFSTQGWIAKVVDVSAAAEAPRSRELAGLVLLAPLETPAGSTWSLQTEAFLKNSFKLTKAVGQDLLKSAANGGAIFACITRMDGAFGLRRVDPNPAQGSLAGLAKTAAHEWPGVACRAIDVAHVWDDAAAIAAAIFRELATDGPVEVGLDASSRRGLEMVPKAVDPRDSVMTPHDVFLITGGARGVTAEAAIALARRYRPQLVLLGRSPAPTQEPVWLSGLENDSEIKQAILTREFADRVKPKAKELQAAFDRHRANREINHTLARISETGAQVVYRGLDVRDFDAVCRVVDEVHSNFGPIRGLIHAAGVLEDRLIVDKTVEQFDRVFDTKVMGLRNLLTTLKLDELRHLVLFSSVSARFGNRGQSDYAMANELFNKVAHCLAARLPRCQVRSLNWGPWDGGMVTPGLKREFARQGIDLIPLDVGAAALVDELGDSSSAVEVVLGAGFKQSAIVKPTPRAFVETHSDFTLAFERTVELSDHAFLRSHILAGRPVLPLAMAMEWMGHAAIHANPGLQICGFENVRVFKGVAVEEAAPTLRFLTATPQPEDAIFRVPVEMRSGAMGGRDTVHVAGIAVLAAKRSAAPAIAYSDAVIEKPYPRSIGDIYSDVLFHGEHLRGIQKVDGWSARGLIAQLRTAPSPTHWMAEPLRSDWLVDPLILDGAFQMAILWCAEELGAVSLPSRVAAYHQYRPTFPKDGVSAVLEVRGHNGHKMVCDITIFDLDAAVVARIDGYECTADASLRAAFRQTGVEAAR